LRAARRRPFNIRRHSAQTRAGVADLYTLTRPIGTFVTREEAEKELERAFGEEPSWVGTMSVEPFELVVAAKRDDPREAR
jgi:hypothetical protein